MKLNCRCFVYFLAVFMDFRPTNYPGEHLVAERGSSLSGFDVIYQDL